MGGYAFDRRRFGRSTDTVVFWVGVISLASSASSVRAVPTRCLIRRKVHFDFKELVAVRTPHLRRQPQLPYGSYGSRPQSLTFPGSGFNGPPMPPYPALPESHRHSTRLGFPLLQADALPTPAVPSRPSARRAWSSEGRG